MSHSLYGGSSIARVMACPGSVRMQDGLPDTPSPYAEEGTRAHGLAEYCLLTGQTPEYADPEAPREMIGAVRTYVNAVYADAAKMGDRAFSVEEKVEIKTWGNEEAWGSYDAALFDRETGHLIVYDFKYGEGVAVSPVENKQLSFYASALAKIHQTNNVTLCIVQPRAHDAENLGVAYWHIDDVTYLDRFDRDAAYAYEQSKLPNPPLATGPHCQFCRAAGICPAKREEALEPLQGIVMSGGVDSLPQTVPAPETLTLEQISKVLSAKKLIEGWLDAVASYALTAAKNGAEVPGFKLVDGVSRAKWSGTDAEISDYLELFCGVGIDQTRPRKLVTITEAEKLLKAAGHTKDVIDGVRGMYTTKDPGAPTLVPLSDKREALPSASEAFKSIKI